MGWIKCEGGSQKASAWELKAKMLRALYNVLNVLAHRTAHGEGCLTGLNGAREIPRVSLSVLVCLYGNARVSVCMCVHGKLSF